MPKTQLSLVLAFCKKDYETALALIQWVADITPKTDIRRFLFIYPKSMGEEPQKKIHDILFPRGWCDLYFTNPLFDPTGWPQGPNAMFDCACREMYDVGPFLWLEADSWPTCPEWLATLEEDYFKQGQPFYGNKVPNESSPVGAHMNGVAIYPMGVVRYATKYFNNIDIPFDVVSSVQVIHQMYDTQLIQHCWRPELPFKSLDLILPKTVLFHQCKDISLRNLLYKKYFCKATNEVSPIEQKPKKVRRAK